MMMPKGTFTAAAAVVVVVVLLLASTCGSDRDVEPPGAAPLAPDWPAAPDEAGSPSIGRQPDDEASPAPDARQTGSGGRPSGGPSSSSSSGGSGGSRGASGAGGNAPSATEPTGATGTPGPPSATPIEVLDRSVTCTPGIKGRKTVVLVPGTGMTVPETWGWGYARALPRAGFAVCTVELAGRSLVSIYKQADYVVHAIRKARRLSGRKVSVIGHSQGGSHPLWAMKFWPDVRAAVDDYIGLAPGVNGTRLGNLVCATGSCSAISWQVRFGSAYLTRLHRGGLPVGPSYTNVYTNLDEIVVPQPRASHIPGGSNIAVQSVCPLRVVEHAAIIADSVAWALAVDALTHRGPADASRLENRLALCAVPLLPGVDLVGMALGLLSGGGHAATGLFTEPQLTAEPRLPSYAD